jgi:hypothetical protein
MTRPPDPRGIRSELLRNARDAQCVASPSDRSTGGDPRAGGWGGDRSGGLERRCIEVGDADVRAEAHVGSQVLSTPRPIPRACPTPFSLVIDARPVSGLRPTEPRRSDAICRVEGAGSRRRRARGSALVMESLRVPAVTPGRSRHAAWYRDCVSDDTDRTGQRGKGPHQQHGRVVASPRSG